MRAHPLSKRPSALKVITELLKRFRIEFLDAQPVLLCPLREAVYATNEAQDTAWLIPTLFEPKDDRICSDSCLVQDPLTLQAGPYMTMPRDTTESAVHGEPEHGWLYL